MPIPWSLPQSDWQKARRDHARDILGLARLLNIRACRTSAADMLVASTAIALCPIAGKCPKSVIAKDVSEIPGKL
jgi:hypothetical protein